MNGPHLNEPSRVGATRLDVPAATLAFLGGFVVMVLEIVGARFLAGEFGGTFHVWVSQIGVVMIALAAGYYAGGALADRQAGLRWLAMLLGAAGLVVTLVPFYAPPVLEAIILRHPADAPVPALWRKVDPALGSAAVFLAPCLVLAMLPPCLIRWSARNLEGLGRLSGRVIAWSTLGSIAGVFAAGYVLIDWLRLSSIFRSMGVVTVLLGALCWRLDRQLVRRALLLVVLLATTGPVAAQTVVFETTSAYHRVRVTDQAGRRTLWFNRSEETRMSLTNPLQGHFEYVEYFLLPRVWHPGLTNVLLIGLGGGSAQRLWPQYCPATTVDTVEVDPVVRQIARDYFRFEEGPRQRLFLEDGRQYLRRNTTRYGAIILDAYTEGRYGASLPYHLATQEFFTLARDHLDPEGVLAYNVMGSLGGWRADIVGALYRTLKAVFPHVYLFPATESQNVVLLATRGDQPVTSAWLNQQARTLYQSGKLLLPTLGTRLAAWHPDPPPAFERCPVLTDDYAPVDGLLGEGRSP